MGFRLVLKSVTLSDLERRNGHYFALFFSFSPSLLSPFWNVAVLTFAILVCRRFDQAPANQ